MKNILRVLLVFMISLIIFSCADSKEFYIDGKKTIVEPYGWFDLNAKNDSIEYKINTGNIIISVIGFETVILPIYLTGDQLYEPIRKKK